MTRADLHIHTTFSDGTATPEDLLNYYALHSDIRVLAITDHDTLDGAHHARRFAQKNPDVFKGLEVIVGEEVSSSDGHIVGLFLEEWIPPGMSAARTVEAIHAQGGLAIAAHPYTSVMKSAGLVGVGDLVEELPFDAIETINANFTEVFANRQAQKVASRIGKAQTGSSDGHFLDAVGMAFTEFEGTNASDLRQALENGTTRPGGRCYGLPTILRYVFDRVRSGEKLLPQRHSRLASNASELDIEVHSESCYGGAILSLGGRLDSSSNGELNDALTLLSDAGVSVVLDFEKVTFMDSSGITSLVRALKSLRRNSAVLALARCNENIRRILTVARLDRAFATFESVEAAKIWVLDNSQGSEVFAMD